MKVAIRRRKGGGGKSYEPTPRDIRRVCEQIQATWSPREKIKRAGRNPDLPEWVASEVRLREVSEPDDLGDGLTGLVSQDDK